MKFEINLISQLNSDSSHAADVDLVIYSFDGVYSLKKTGLC